MESGVPITAPQEWARRLGELDLDRVRLRSAGPNERPQVSAEQSAGGTRYRVVAVLSQDNELQLPKQNFKLHNISAMRGYFTELATQGPDEGKPRGRFNLTQEQFRALFAAMSQPVDFSTQGKSVQEAFTRLQRELSYPFQGEHRLAGTSNKLDVELEGLTLGTALAIVLRAEGTALYPEQPRGGKLRLEVAPYDRQRESWPVGWKPQGSPRMLAPKLYEFHSIEISGYALHTALTALAPRLQMPVIVDRWIVDREAEPPLEEVVHVERRKTYLKKALDQMLSQARLAGEIRTDELGEPFYWITKFGPDSPRAAE